MLAPAHAADTTDRTDCDQDDQDDASQSSVGRLMYVARPRASEHCTDNNDNGRCSAHDLFDQTLTDCLRREIINGQTGRRLIPVPVGYLTNSPLCSPTGHWNMPRHVAEWKVFPFMHALMKHKSTDPTNASICSCLLQTTLCTASNSQSGIIN